MGFDLSEDYPPFEDKEPVDNCALTEEEINDEFALISAMMTDEVLIAGKASVPLREGEHTNALWMILKSCGKKYRCLCDKSAGGANDRGCIQPSYFRGVEHVVKKSLNQQHQIALSDVSDCFHRLG